MEEDDGVALSFPHGYVLQDQSWLLHSPVPFLALYICLSVTHTQAGLLSWESLTALCTVRGRQSIHYVCPTHTVSLHGSVPHAPPCTRTHLCTHSDAYKKWPADTQAFSQMSGNLPHGLKQCLTHTKIHTHTPCFQTLCFHPNRGIQLMCKHPAASPFHFR